VPSPIVLAPTFPRANGAADREALEVTRAELRFLEPPEPGAHAQLAVTLGNRSDVPSRPVTIGIPADWFDRFRIIGAVSPVLDDRARGDRYRYFDFPGLPPGADSTLELHVLAADEDVGAPEVQVAVVDGQSLGRVRPEVVAPRAPRPRPRAQRAEARHPDRRRGHRLGTATVRRRTS
jgi:hypothetical protein